MEKLLDNKFLVCIPFTVLAVFLYCGFYALPSADDYFYANLVHQFGLVNAQIQHYIDWSGRYTATFFLTLFSMAGYGHYWIVPWVCIFSLITSTFLLFITAFPGILTFRYWFLFSLSLVALFLSVSTAGPDHGIKVVNEGFYWYSGAVTYIISLSLCLILLALFIKRERNEAVVTFVPVAGLLLFVIIGLNETAMFLICFSCVPWLFLRRKRWGWATTLFLISLVIICSALMVFAPGNSVRMNTSDGGNILSAIGVCFEKLGQILLFYLVNPMVWLFTLVNYRSIDTLKQKLICDYFSTKILYWGGALLVYLLYFPVAYSLNSGAPDRLVAFIGYVALCLSILYIHGLLGWVREKVPSRKLVLGTLTLLSLVSCNVFLNPLVIGCKTLFSAHRFKQQHYERFEVIHTQRKAGHKTVIVPFLQRNELLLFEDLIPGTKNIDFAKYFGVDAVLVKEKKIK